MVMLKKIMNNNDYCDFFKILAKKYNKYVGVYKIDFILYYLTPEFKDLYILWMMKIFLKNY